MRKSQRLLIERTIAMGKFKRTHQDIPIDEVSLEYKDDTFIFIHNNKIVDKIKVGGKYGRDNSGNINI